MIARPALHCAIPEPTAHGRLVCLPHAGGSGSFFRPWARRVHGWELHTVTYPGRAERISEPPAEDLRGLAQDIAREIEPLLDRPVALFGHSLGAAVALEIAVALESQGRELEHLFASGSRDGPLPPPDELTPTDEDDDEAIIARLVAMGGTDPAAAADPIFRELVLPYVRSDARMFHAYRMSPDLRLTCPVTTLVGDVDADADRRPWADIARGRHLEMSVRGGHFYLLDDPPFQILQERLSISRPSVLA